MDHQVRAELIYNPFSGQALIRRGLDDVIALLTNHGWSVNRWEVTRPMEATKRARDAVERGAKVVIAAGGDGTVSEVANGLVGTDTALGVLPTGTTNTWALQMGIPTLNPILPGTRTVKFISDLEDRIARPLPANYYRRVLRRAAQVLIEGHTIAVDIGKIADRYFLMWAGIGVDAAVVECMAPKGKKVLGYWAYVIPAIGMLRRYSSTEVRLTLDEKAIKTSASLILVSNIQLYGGGFPIGIKARVNDAKLDVCIFHGEGVFTFMSHALKVLAHRHSLDSKIEYYQCSRIEITSDDDLPVHTDGELFTRTPVTIETLPTALKTIVPQNAPKNLFNE
ncbi:diacylglycerol/lipid kinase family protein [Chloroflexota bacterium]